jgi:hypothetical protein
MVVHLGGGCARGGELLDGGKVERLGGGGASARQAEVGRGGEVGREEDDDEGVTSSSYSAMRRVLGWLNTKICHHNLQVF